MTGPSDSARPARVLAPADVRSLAHARRDARLARDWSEADRLKVEIESAGWRVVDRGVDFALIPGVPPDVVVGEVTWHGSSASVPSVLEAPADRRASILLVRRPQATSVSGARLGDGDQLVVVTSGTDGGVPDDDPSLGETVRLTGDPTPGARLAAGLRRARGRIVVALHGEPALEADVLDRVVHALDDPSVACVGGYGATTSDLRTFVAVERGDADVLLPGVVAFRRGDAIAALPVDERYASTARMIEWWSLRLRDSDGENVRRVVVLPGLAGTSGVERAVEATEDRASKRDFYRLNDAFGGRPDLLSGLR